MVAAPPGPKLLRSRPRIGGASAPVSPIRRGSGRSVLEIMTKRRPEAVPRFVVSSNRSRVFWGRACVGIRPSMTIRQVVANLVAYPKASYLAGCCGVMLIAGPRSSLCGMKGPSIKPELHDVPARIFLKRRAGHEVRSSAAAGLRRDHRDFLSLRETSGRIQHFHDGDDVRNRLLGTIQHRSTNDIVLS